MYEEEEESEEREGEREWERRMQGVEKSKSQRSSTKVEGSLQGQRFEASKMDKIKSQEVNMYRMDLRC